MAHFQLSNAGNAATKRPAPRLRLNRAGNRDGRDNICTQPRAGASVKQRLAHLVRQYLTLTIMYASRFMRALLPHRTPGAMLVCQCNMITSKEIEDIVLSLLADDPWQLVVPAKVYRELSRRAKCSGCVPNVVDIIVRVTENYHLQQARTPGELVELETRLAKLKQQQSGDRRERRSTSQRAA